MSDRIRHIVYKLAGMKIGGRCAIWGPLTIRPIGGARNIAIGAGTTINTNARFGVPSAPVTIGRNVLVATNVCFETVGHGLVYEPGRGRGDVIKPIVVEDEAWIGAGAIITGGTTIGRGAVVAAGAVVIEDVPPCTLVAGVPARVVKQL